MADFLLIHGTCHGVWCWRDMVAPLTALGHTVRSIDMPGHGGDTTPLNEVDVGVLRRGNTRGLYS